MVNRVDLKVIQEQLLSVPDVGLIRQEITDALTSFAERDQDSLHVLVGRAEAVIAQAGQRVAAEDIYGGLTVADINPT